MHQYICIKGFVYFMDVCKRKQTPVTRLQAAGKAISMVTITNNILGSQTTTHRGVGTHGACLKKNHTLCIKHYTMCQSEVRTIIYHKGKMQQ